MMDALHAGGRSLARVTLASLLLVAAIFLATAGDPGVVRAQFAGRVAGVVVNGTAGGAVPEAFEVVLVTTDLDGNVLGQRTTRVDSRGLFEFTNVQSGDDVLVRLVTDYEGVISTVRLEEELLPANLRIEIHETTRSLDSIKVVNEVIVARPDGPSRLMGFLELVTLRNDGDRTFVADLTDPNVTGLSMVRFGLPENYEGFTGVSVDPPLPAGSLLDVGPGFALTNPIPPGEYRIFFDYFIRYGGNVYAFGRNLPFGAEEVRVLMPKDTATVTGNGLAPIDDVTLGETVYSVVSGTNYARGDRVEFKFDALPQPGLAQSVRNRLRGADAYVKIGVPVGAGVVMAGLLAYVFLVRRRGRPSAVGSVAPGAVASSRASGGEDSPGTPPAGDTNPEREALVREIALLDQRFDAGGIEESEYRRRRADLTARALGGT